MLKAMLAATASLALIGAGACSQGPTEEAGEAADTAYEQTTTGTTDPTQGPMEEAGEQLDQTLPSTDTVTPPSTDTAPSTTP